MLANPPPYKPDLLEKLGKRLILAGPVVTFILSLIGITLFMTITAWPLNCLSRSAQEDLKDKLKPNNTNASVFLDKVEHISGKAYRTFFDLGLSKKNFITNMTVERSLGGMNWPFTYWEVYVDNNFNFGDATSIFQNQVADAGKGVTIQAEEYDAKTIRISISIDGRPTHKAIFTKTAMENEDAGSVVYAALSEKDETVAVKPGMPFHDQIPKISFAGPAKVAIIIDDIGFRDAVDNQFFQLPQKLTFSILPYSPGSAAFLQKAVAASREVMAHLPMEPIEYPRVRPGRGALLISMNDRDILTTVKDDLQVLPGVSGANNHMGSKFTQDPSKMELVLASLKEKGLYFIDSRTSGASKAYEIARRMGIRAGMRNVFLDHDPQYPSVMTQLDNLAQIALRRGYAIAIGHPNLSTYNALLAKLPEFERRGIVIVPISNVVQ